MEKKYLIINTGSASKKYAIFRNGVLVISARFEQEDDHVVVTVEINKRKEKAFVSNLELQNSIRYILDVAKANKIIYRDDEIDAVGVRIVSPGKFFTTHKIIDEEYVSKLSEMETYVPLHIYPALSEIRAVRSTLPVVPIVGVSDSATHRNIPTPARMYGINQNDAKKFDIYRFGYHGISVASVLRKIHKISKKKPRNIIVCHLGGGASVTAVKDGRSVDTSMGFTPVSGLLMNTRSGDIDAGALIYLAQKKKMNFRNLQNYLNIRSGLLGVSGKSEDVRDLLYNEDGRDTRSKNALDMFVYRIKKHIGAYSATLNGIDMIIFTATVSERNPRMRSRICKDLDGLGVILDEYKNITTINKDGIISDKKSPVQIAVIVTEEMREIEYQTKKVILKQVSEK